MRSPCASGYESDLSSLASATDSSSESESGNSYTCAMEDVVGESSEAVAASSNEDSSAGASKGGRALPVWRDVAVGVLAVDAQALIDAGKRTRITRSHSTSCTMCTKAHPHDMNYNILECRSTMCQSLYPTVPCQWRAKMSTCSETGVAAIYKTNAHLCDASSPRKAVLTAAMKEFCRDMVAQGLKPQRIRNAMREKFTVPAERMPTLSQVQGFCNHFASSKLGNHDRFEDILASVRAHAFREQTDHEPITFTDQNNEAGQLMMGDGTDESPFVVGVTTKNLLQRLDRPPASFVLHVDATFKLSQLGYPVFVIGVSDLCRSFHLVALCIISQQTEDVYTLALASFRRLYHSVTGKTIQLTYIMGDADNAQYNALYEVLGQDTSFTFLMCFFHVMLNVDERLKNLPDPVSAVIRSDIYDLHFCASLDEYRAVALSAVQRWQAMPEAVSFASYFVGQWLTGRYWTWQCFLHPPGYATTNNPVEQFNHVLKRVYSMHRKLKMGTLLEQLLKCATDMSESTTPFRDYIEVSSSLNRRMQHMARDELLIENAAVRHPQPGIVSVLSQPAMRIFVPTAKRTKKYLAVSVQFGKHYSRMEQVGQPSNGWIVNVANRFCPCRYWLKFGTCVHLLFAMQRSQRVDGMGRRILFDRSAPRKRGRKSAAAVGRPANSGPALSRE